MCVRENDFFQVPFYQPWKADMCHHLFRKVSNKKNYTFCQFFKYVGKGWIVFRRQKCMLKIISGTPQD